MAAFHSHYSISAMIGTKAILKTLGLFDHHQPPRLDCLLCKQQQEHAEAAVWIHRGNNHVGTWSCTQRALHVAH